MIDRYDEKRDFTRTEEPHGRVASGRTGPLIFVVQKHAASRLHYDFRLEMEGVLKSWAVPKGPSTNPRDKRLAVIVEDHPIDYADFEGSIPEGDYGGGQVIVWDRGTYSPDEGGHLSFENREEAERRMQEGLASGKLSIRMRGEKLQGSWALVQMHGRGPENWLLIKHKDEHAGTSKDITLADRSVISGRTLEDMKSGPTV